MSDVLKQFDVLCGVAMAAFNEELEISYESAMLDILNFVKRNPKHREDFVEKFKVILCSNSSPFEVVAFCMRELQWLEIRDFVILKRESSEDPRSEALRDVLTAYDEFWPDADMYRYYGLKGPE